eukprot:3798796-Karenia_brevis.AAC.1
MHRRNNADFQKKGVMKMFRRRMNKDIVPALPKRDTQEMKRKVSRKLRVRKAKAKEPSRVTA